MNCFTWVFLVCTASGLGLHLWLGMRHIRHVAANRSEVPGLFVGQITEEAHRKAADYTIAGTRFRLAARVLGTLLLLVWTLGGGINMVERIWHETIASPVMAGTLVLLSVAVIGAAIDLPVDAWRQFRVEQKFGFNNMTAGLFIADFGKTLLLTVLLGGPVGYVLIWLMENLPHWWLWGWLTWLGFVLSVTWSYPVLIAPLFNKFAPLEDGELLARIQNLLRRVGFSGKGVRVMDGSKRSSHSNAYFTGFGQNKRVVLFDTLLKSLSHAQLEAVLAHELGHFKCHHIRKRILLMAGMALAGFAVVYWLRGQTWFFQGLGVAQPTSSAALLLFLLASPSFAFLLQPWLVQGSRRHEFEADRFAARHADGEELCGALARLTEDNASTLTPDPLHSAYYDSHPPVLARIAALQSQQQA